MKHKLFNKTRLATSLSIILGATVTTPTFAAEAESAEAQIEVIQVTGIRSSMIKSMDIKRSSQGVVDSINAEDMGKFPDSNLAESLQRITGVSIDRANGEGSKISVRGFSSSRNLVLLNGRSMPATGTDSPSSTGDRSFDFSNIAAEGISSVEVYKTSKASMATGGIGATINVKTNRPLDNPGMHAVISGQALHDTSTEEGSNTTPELSGLYSNTFADETFGISLSGSYSKRESGNQQSRTGEGWNPFVGGTGALVLDQQQGISDATQVYSVAQRQQYRFEEQQRKRTNAQLVLEYSPMDSLTMALDYTYIKKDTDTQYNAVSAWFSNGQDGHSIWTEGAIASPLFYSQMVVYPVDHPLYDPLDAPGDLSFSAADYGVQDETNSLGFNLEWQASDNLNLVFDYHNSKSENSPNNKYGSDNLLESAAFVKTGAAVDYTGTIPVLAVQGGNSMTPEDVIITGSVFTNRKIRAHIEQEQLSGTYVFEEAGSIDFGISLTTAELRGQIRNVQRDNWGGEGGAGTFSADDMVKKSIYDQFDADGGDFSSFGDEQAAWQDDILNSYFAFDFQAVRQKAEDTLAVQSGVVGDCGTSFCPSSDYSGATDLYTREEMTAVYFQYNYDNEIGTMPYDLHFGFRYEETDIKATSAVPVYNGTSWNAAGEISLIDAGSRTFETKNASYDHFLPSIDFSIEPTDDIVLRAAYSKTIGRHGYASLMGGATLQSQAGAGSGYNGNLPNGANSGNPGLLPLESVNFDFSAEWYYGEGSYVALGYFKKTLTNDTETLRTPYTQADLFDPSAGPWVDAAYAAGIEDQNWSQVRQWISDNIDDAAISTDQDGRVVIQGTSADNLMLFDIESSQNSSAETGFNGLEFAVQHLFGDTGFGGIVNYTYVNSDNEYDNLVVADQTAETGISDTANLIAFYEKDGLSVRIAYNWRDEYLANSQRVTYNQEEYRQIDMSVNYDLPQVEGLTVFFNAINLTDEYTRQVARSSREAINVTQTGARYSLGARYSF